MRVAQLRSNLHRVDYGLICLALVAHLVPCCVRPIPQHRDLVAVVERQTRNGQVEPGHGCEHTRCVGIKLVVCSKRRLNSEVVKKANYIVCTLGGTAPSQCDKMWGGCGYVNICALLRRRLHLSIQFIRRRRQQHDHSDHYRAQVPREGMLGSPFKYDDDVARQPGVALQVKSHKGEANQEGLYATLIQHYQ